MLRWTSTGVLDPSSTAHTLTLTVEDLPDGAPADVRSVLHALAALPFSQRPSDVRLVAGVLCDAVAGNVALTMQAPEDARVLGAWSPENGSAGRSTVENARTPFAWRIAPLVAAGALAHDTLEALGVSLRARTVALNGLWDRTTPDVRELRAVFADSGAGFCGALELEAAELLLADTAHAVTVEVVALDVPAGVGDGFPFLADLAGGLFAVPCVEGVATHLDGLTDGVANGAPLALRAAAYVPTAADVIAVRLGIGAAFALHILRAVLARLGDRWMVNTMLRVSAWRRELDGRKTLPPPPLPPQDADVTA